MPVPDDIYTKEVDFTALSLQYPEFAKRLKANRQLDFTDPESVRQLTKALLHRDFDLTIELPEDRLCPPVPNRFNYILFLQRLIDSTRDNYETKPDLNHKAIGIDIGTGASAIYPLIACRHRPPWRFIATELDEKSREYAKTNVKSNGLQDRIRIIQPDDGNLLPSNQIGSFNKIDFVMTNPPFYTSQAELDSLAKQKSRPPNSACTGAPVEMICPGGEASFVTQLVVESSLPANREKIQWFSSMLGKLGSVTVIIDKLKTKKCANFAVTEFVQGQKTRRWCVAWSWQGLRPPQSIARGTNAVEKKLLPFPTELEICYSGGQADFLKALHSELQNLSEVDWFWRADLHVGLVRSMKGDVWSRSARRKQKRQVVEQIDSMQIGEDDLSNNQEKPSRPQLVVKITPRETSGTTKLELRWLEGLDNVVFESFHGWLKRRLLIHT